MSGIYLRDGDGFVPMRDQAWTDEDLMKDDLQALIAAYPNVLVEDRSGELSGWLIVKRETGVPDRPEGADRWSLDHLFLDHSGVPTLVETKRSSDTRLRREVIAQGLDYAANATRYWNVETILALFESQHAPDPQARLAATLGITDYQGYWDRVKTNLAADRIRLVFVADEIPAELRSIVEFLNRQMKETEVVAIEFKQYVDAAGQRQTVVPRVIGQTEAAKAAKRAGPRLGREWDEESVLADVAAHGRDPAVARAVLDWAKAQPATAIEYGKGSKAASAMVRIERAGQPALTAFRVYSNGQIEVPINLDTPEACDELRRRVYEVVPNASKGPVPTFYIDALESEKARQRFFETMKWAFAEALSA
jgi:hypothetical protein